TRVSRVRRTLAEARANPAPIDWDAYEPPVAAHPGRHIVDQPIDELVDYIDWTPFFQAWELRGVYPKILDDATVGPQARALFDDAQTLLRRMIDERAIRARAVIGLFPARAVGDDVELDTDQGPVRVIGLR